MPPLSERELVDMAATWFNEGYNCAESVLLALAKYLEAQSPLLPRVASGFGGGIARRQTFCGALSGAILGLGLKYGRISPEESRDPVYTRVQRLLDEFKREFGSHSCRELTGIDFSDPEQFKQYQSRVHHETCVGLVRFAAARSLAILRE